MTMSSRRALPDRQRSQTARKGQRAISGNIDTIGTIAKVGAANIGLRQHGENRQLFGWRKLGKRCDGSAVGRIEMTAMD
jgi:hypothetical protein